MVGNILPAVICQCVDAGELEGGNALIRQGQFHHLFDGLHLKSGVFTADHRLQRLSCPAPQKRFFIVGELAPPQFLSLIHI